VRLRKRKIYDLSPDEVFLDEKEIPGLSRERREGMIEKPISREAFLTFSIILLFFGWILFGRVFWLQIVRGKELEQRAESNSIQTLYIEPPRGIIYDRNGKELAFNEAYKDDLGIIRYRRVSRHPYAFSHVLGFVGDISSEDIEKEGRIAGVPEIGKSGIEQTYNDILRGKPGKQDRELNVRGTVIAEGPMIQPREGENISLTIDAELQEAFWKTFDDTVRAHDFLGGAGVIFSINDGEILSLVSVPSFDVNAFSRGLEPKEAKEIFSDGRAPIFNRALSGAFAPGSTIKPFLALAALEERVIDPNRQLYSSGALTIPDPFRKGAVSRFGDWRAHGFVDMRRAIAVSSNVYFYTVGGGYEDITGLGVSRIKLWLNRFGFDGTTGIDILGERAGFLPDPEWKKTAHPENPIWRIGDTYHISIGQGDVLVTPLGIARGLAMIATGGKKITPHLLKKNVPVVENYLPINPVNYSIVREGMFGVTRPGGTASSLGSFPFSIAGKTGSAETSAEQRTHSWFIGYAPYENPRMGIVVFLESGPRANSVGAVHVVSEIFRWIQEHEENNILVR